MAEIYVRSTDGSNSDNGSTWALAKLDLAGAAAIDSAGDTIYVSDNHAESTAASITIAFAGTGAAPVNVICADDSAEPPTASTTSGIVTSTGFIVLTGNVYVYGLSFLAGSGSSSSTSVLTLGGITTNFKQTYDNCVFSLLTTGTSARLNAASDATGAIPATVLWQNSSVKFANANHAIGLCNVNFVWNGGGIVSGSTALTGSLFKSPSTTIRGANANISGVDLTNLGAGCSIFDASSGSFLKAVIRNCKLPASWTGGLTTGTLDPGQRFEMYNCDNADTNYRLWIEEYAGSVKHETTIVRSGGATDGVTPISWVIASSANAEFPLFSVKTPEIVIWNETTGSAITADIEIVHDSQGAGTGNDFTDEEIWLEVMYLGASGTPLGVFISNIKEDVLGTATDHANSSETWTTTGLTTPVKQTLSVSFTPQEKGYIHATVYVAKASKTVYVDPLITVS